MLHNYFNLKRPTPNVQEDEPVSKKSKDSKRTTITGFDKKEICKRIDGWEKKPPAGNWRSVTDIKVKVKIFIRNVLAIPQNHQVLCIVVIEGLWLQL